VFFQEFRYRLAILLGLAWLIIFFLPVFVSPGMVARIARIRLCTFIDVFVERQTVIDIFNRNLYPQKVLGKKHQILTFQYLFFMESDYTVVLIYQKQSQKPRPQVCGGGRVARGREMLQEVINQPSFTPD